MKTEHKHKELILQWTFGAIIQFKDWTGNWKDCKNNNPEWHSNLTYRIKPEPKPNYSKFTGLYEIDLGEGHDMSGVYSNNIQDIPEDNVNDSGMWNLCNKLELIFDGETRELKDVKIHGKD